SHHHLHPAPTHYSHSPLLLTLSNGSIHRRLRPRHHQHRRHWRPRRVHRVWLERAAQWPRTDAAGSGQRGHLRLLVCRLISAAILLPYPPPPPPVSLSLFCIRTRHALDGTVAPLLTLPSTSRFALGP
ncbi:hypothetical protein B0H19DRAFT_1383556, partial [Mycena capillaripes]